MSNFIKIRPLGADLFYADGHKTDRQTGRQADGRTGGHDEATSSFSRFCECA